MGLGDKFMNAGEEVAGKVKETTGRATDIKVWRPGSRSGVREH